MRRPPIVPLATALLLAGCSHDNPFAQVNGPHIDQVRGSGQSDTVLATPVQSLVVRVRNGPDAVAGTTVRFEAVTAGYPQKTAVVLVGDLSSLGYGTFASGTTGSDGQTSVLIQMGIKAGTAKVAITVPDLNLSDTATFTVLPGGAAGVQVLPADTAIYVSGRIAERAAVVDRFGNPRPESGTLSAGGGAVSLAGGIATGVATGRSWVVGKSGTWSDTGWVSVVPHGTLAGARGDSLCVFDLDGSNAHCLAPLTGNGLGGYGVQWSSAGTEVMWAEGPYTLSRLFAVNMSGVVRRVIPSPPASLIEEAYGSFASDGTIYFSGQLANQNFGLWHVDAAGASPTSVYNLGAGGLMWRPSPSPDRSQVALVSIDGGGNVIVETYTPATDALSTWSVVGQTPRWSPDGAHIAFVAPYYGSVSIVAPDGSGQRTLAAPRTYSDAGANWSPDSHWLVARGGASLELIDVASGTALPLGYTAAYSEAAWKPN